MKFLHEGIPFSYYSIDWRQKQYTGEAFIKINGYKINTNFLNGEIDKTKEGLIVKEDVGFQFRGKLCLSKKNLTGFIYND